jgi:hypothetical protein
MAKPARQNQTKQNPRPSQSQQSMQPIPQSAALTYVRMVRRQHATPKLQHLLAHRKRIRVPSKRRVRHSKVAQGQACTSKSNKTKSKTLSIATKHATHPSKRRALTYVRMVRRQHATPKLQHLLAYRKRIRVPSKFYVRRSKVTHGHACTSKSNKIKFKPLSIVTPHATHPSKRSPHLSQDGSQAARDARIQAPVQTLQAHPRAFQAHGASWQGCSWPCLYIESKLN